MNMMNARTSYNHNFLETQTNALLMSIHSYSSLSPFSDVNTCTSLISSSYIELKALHSWPAPAATSLLAVILILLWVWVFSL